MFTAFHQKGDKDLDLEGMENEGKEDKKFCEINHLSYFTLINQFYFVPSLQDPTEK